MNKSEQTNEIFKAISEAQGEFKTVEKSSINPHFKSKFAPLDNIIEMLRPVLPKHGLSFVQFTDIAENGIIVETIITHSSGQWISGSLQMPTVKQDPQGYGSALTYGRRYGLAAAFGVASDEDVDGNQENGNGKGKQKEPEKLVNDQQLNDLRDLINNIPGYSEKQFCAEARVKSIDSLPAERFKGAFNHIQSKAAKEAA